MTELKVHEDILFYAFRYALGRQTGAVDRVVMQLKFNWDKLTPQTQKQIKEEILDQERRFKSGFESCYDKTWQKVLALETKIKD